MEKEVTIYEYRGFKVPVYLDDYGQQYYIKFDGEEVGLGTYNLNYESEIESIIDHKLDFICTFDKYPGAVLSWFFNGYNDRDIKLSYRSRTLKVFLVVDESQVVASHYKDIIKESKEILEKYVKVVK